MIKLKKIIKESGLGTSTGEAPKDGNHGNTTKFSTDAKRHFLEIVSTYNKYQEMMDRKSDIVEVAETLSGIIEAAKSLAINEEDDWFDKHTVKRNMGELTKLGSQFEKVTKEAKLLDQRMSGLYEDMGHILSRYYKIGEITEDEMKSRLGMRNESVNEDRPGYGVSDFGDLKDNDLIKAAVFVGKKSKSFIKNLLKQLHRDKTISKQLQSEGILKEDRPGYGVSDFGDLKDNDLIKAILFVSKKSKSFIKNLVNTLKKEKMIDESIKESFTPKDIAMIKKVVDKEKRLIGLSPIFKKMGWHTEYVMIDSVPPHLRLKKKKNDKETYLLVNKKYVDKPDWVSGEIAGGLDESKKSDCDTCDNSSIVEDIKYSKDGYVKLIKNEAGKLVKDITLNGKTYRYNSVYKTYNSVKGNELLHKSDLD